MALFKICHGTKDKLKDLQLHEGYCYFTTDEQKFYIDYVNENNELQRLPLNSKAAIKLAGRVLENELSETIVNYPTTRALYDALQDKILGDLVDDIDTFKKLRDLIKYYGEDEHELSNFEKIAEILLEEGFEENVFNDQLTPRATQQMLDYHLNNNILTINDDKTWEQSSGDNPHETSSANLKKYDAETDTWVNDPLNKVRNCKDEDLGISNALQSELNGKLNVKEGDIGYIFTKEDDSYVWKKAPMVTTINFNKLTLSDYYSWSWGDETAIGDATWWAGLKTWIATASETELKNCLGKTKSVTLTSAIQGTTTHLVRCIGYNCDHDINNTSANTLTFHTANCLANTTIFGSSNGKWIGSTVRSLCQSYYNAFPGKASIIITSQGTCASTNSSQAGTPTYNNETVFLPSDCQIGFFKGCDYSNGKGCAASYDEYDQYNTNKTSYQYYTSNSSRIKKQGDSGSAVQYWERSLDYNYTGVACGVYSDGLPYGSYYYDDSCGFAPAFVIGGGGSELPTLIQYLENNGDDYIDTGFIPNQDTRIDITFTPTDASDYAGNNTGFCAFSAGETYNSKAFECYSWSGAMQVNYGSTNQNVVTDLTTGQVINLTLNKNVCSGDVGGTAFSYTYPTSTFTCPYTMHLFGLSRGVDAGSGSTKLYSCKIYDNDVLVRNYIPVEDSDGVACLYDTVNETYSYLQTVSGGA